VVRCAHQRLTAAGGLIADVDVGEADGLQRRNQDLVKVPPRGATGREHGALVHAQRQPSAGAQYPPFLAQRGRQRCHSCTLFVEDTASKAHQATAAPPRCPDEGQACWQAGRCGGLPYTA
jgi:hypothetical protein